MRTIPYLCGTATLLVLAAPTAADPTTCRTGAMERSIEVVYETPGEPVPCRVVYDKLTQGERKVPWRADHEEGFCEARARELVEKLEADGWACTDPPVEGTSGR